jgi:hypothetical protein
MSRRVIAGIVAGVLALVVAGGCGGGGGGDERKAAIGSQGGKPGSKTKPVPAKRLHGEGFLGNSRVGKVENGKVPCLHVETAERAACAFDKRANKSGSWLESADGDYALTGQSTSLDGEPGGRYVIAAEINPDGTVPALEPSGRDSAGTAYEQELVQECTIETMNTSVDAMDKTTPGYRVINYISGEIGTISNPHPDSAPLVRKTPDGVFYYTGEGAALNDNNGMERNREGVYYRSEDRCHRVISNNAEAPGSKRPTTDAYNRWTVKSSIRWRPANPAAPSLYK